LEEGKGKKQKYHDFPRRISRKCLQISIEVEGIDNAPVIICHLSIGITTVTIIKLIITNSLNLVHTLKKV
jgi:hypothetical protein